MDSRNVEKISIDGEKLGKITFCIYLEIKK